MQIRKEQIISDLKKIGVSNGDHVSVALSFKKIGPIEGGPEGFLDSLVEAVGSEGTLMVNTFTNLFPISEIPDDYVFNTSSTVPNTGLIPKKFLHLKHAFRSKHPAVSVAAVGKFAEFLTKDHNENSNMYLPYEKLEVIEGKYLFIGIGERLVGVRHESQRRAGLWIVPMYVGVKYLTDEGKQKLFLCTLPPCVKTLYRLVPILEKRGMIKRGKIGNAECILAPAEGLIEAMTKILMNKPTLNLCEDIFCVQCRELERMLNLYNRVKNPKLFQNNLLFRKLISFRNKLVLRKYQHLGYKNSVNTKKNRHLDLIEIRLVNLLNKIRNLS